MDGLSFVLFIEKELKKRKIPKGAFYEATGVSSATMSQWRNNIHDPSPENIRRIEKYLGINFRLEPENAGDKAPDQNKKPAAENGNERIPKYDLLNTENQKFIDDMIEKLLKSQSAE